LERQLHPEGMNHWQRVTGVTGEVPVGDKTFGHYLSW
jgi:hypothetical protein